MMVNLSMSTNTTMGSSCEGSTPLKSSSVKVMGGILGWNDTVFASCIAFRCFFRALLKLPLPVNPPDIMLMTSRSPFLPSLLGRSSLLGISPRPTLRSSVILLHPRGGVVSSPDWIFPSWGPLYTLPPLQESKEMPDVDNFLNLILQGLTLLGGVPTILMIPTPMGTVGIVKACNLPWWWNQLGA